MGGLNSAEVRAWPEKTSQKRQRWEGKIGVREKGKVSRHSGRGNGMFKEQNQE